MWVLVGVPVVEVQTQHPARSLGKPGDHGPAIWTSATHVGNLNGATHTLCEPG